MVRGIPEHIKKHRGRGKGKTKTTGIKVFYNNINGFLSKKESLFKIVESLDPDIVALCETKKAGLIKKEELSAYKVIEKPLKQGKEGLLLGVRKGTFVSMRDITDAEIKTLMTIKIEYPKFNLRVVVVHAPQETEKHEARLEFFEEMSVQVERGLTSGDEIMILGDLNGRIEGEPNNVTAVKESPNGKQLYELIVKHKLLVGNFHMQCTGKWTRIQPCRKGEPKKSALDYVLMTDKIHDSLKSIMIDEEKIYCPYREKKENGARRIVYSDHCAMVVELEIDVGHIKKKIEKKSGWRYCQEGYEIYGVESKAVLPLDLTGPTISNVYSSWVVEFEKLLAKCFRRHTFKNKEEPRCRNNKIKNIREAIMKIGKKGKIQRAIAKIYQQKLVTIELSNSAEARAERLRATTSKLTVKERFSPTGYWKVKKAANKGMRKEQVLSSIMKDNGEEVDDACAVIEAYEEEFQKRLANREPEPGWEEYTSETNTVVRSWLQGESESSAPFSLKELEKASVTLNEDSSPGLDNYPPELFTKAGTGAVQSMLLLFNRVKEMKQIPEQWELVKIVTIYKQKGSKKKLKYYRGIFLAIVLSKIFEKMIKNRIEENLQKINLLQAGSRKNRGPPDQVFLLRGVMDHFKFTGKPLFVTAYDFEQAFDSLWLEDCVLSLKELGVEKEYLQLIYNLNKRAQVTVQTPFGPSKTFETDPI